MGQFLHGNRQGLDLAVGDRRGRVAAKHPASDRAYLFAGFLFFVINYAIELFGRYIEKRVALP